MGSTRGKTAEKEKGNTSKLSQKASTELLNMCNSPKAY